MKFGKEQNDLLTWLEKFSLRETDSNVCIIEGFSGLGKTKLTSLLQTKLKEIQGFKVIKLNITDGIVSFGDFLLEFLAELKIVNIDILNNNISVSNSTIKAIQTILDQENICIIIDDFQNLLVYESRIQNDFKQFLQNISIRNTKGRIIVLSNQGIQSDNWCDQFIFKKFPPFSLREGIEGFEELLKEKNIQINNKNRKSDIVDSLGRNPRAMNIFVKCLSWCSHEELIGELPEPWEARDRQFSSKLLKDLEEKLIKKNLEQLDSTEIKIIEYLSAFRKPFQKEAIEKFIVNTEAALRIRDKLSNYYFIENNNYWFNLNPVLKEISKLKLLISTKQFKLAHSKAAEYYTRHFRDKISYSDKTEGQFVEARYHLIMSKNEEMLERISQNLGEFLKSTIKYNWVPDNTNLLNDQIALLTAFLGDSGPKGYEYNLALCLESRGLKNDICQALVHAKRALGFMAPPETWVLNIKLEEKLNGLFSAIDIACSAIEKNSGKPNSFKLYLIYAELLEKNNQLKEAIDLLYSGFFETKDKTNLFSLYLLCAKLKVKNRDLKGAIDLLEKAIKRTELNNNSFALYKECADLLEKDNQIEAAIKLLDDGIKQISPTNNSYALYLSKAKFMCKMGKKIEAIELLKNSIEIIPENNSVVSIYQECSEIMVSIGQIKEGIDLLKEGIRKISPKYNSFVIYLSCAELLYKENNIKEAIDLIYFGIDEVPIDQNLYSLYLKGAQIMVIHGQIKEAIELLKDGFEKIPPEKNGLALLEHMILLNYRENNISELHDFSLLTKNKDHSLLAKLLKNYLEKNFNKANEFILLEDFNERYSSIKGQLVFGLFCEGRLEEIEDIILDQSFHNTKFTGNLWLLSWIHLKKKEIFKAKKYFNRIINEMNFSISITEKDLIKYWWDSRAEKNSPALYFPHLPIQFTGYIKDLSINSKSIFEDMNLLLNYAKSPDIINNTL